MGHDAIQCVMNIHEHVLHEMMQSTWGVVQSNESFICGNTFKSLNKKNKNKNKNEKAKH